MLQFQGHVKGIEVEIKLTGASTYFAKFLKIDHTPEYQNYSGNLTSVSRKFIQKRLIDAGFNTTIIANKFYLHKLNTPTLIFKDNPSIKYLDMMEDKKLQEVLQALTEMLQHLSECSKNLAMYSRR